MAIVFDLKKNAHNITTRGIPFEDVSLFEWHSASVDLDLRRDYGEDRYIAVGLIGDRLHVLVFTPRGADLRVTSLRRANDREEAALPKPDPYLTNEDNPELTPEQILSMRPASEVLPPELYESLSRSHDAHLATMRGTTMNLDWTGATATPMDAFSRSAAIR